MKKQVKRIIILFSICLLVLIGGLIVDKNISKEYFIELNYDEVIEKLNNKETFVLMISQTTCSHCLAYKPKLSDVANRHKIKIYYIEIDLLNDEKYKDLKSKLGFSGTPNTIFIKNGTEKTAATRIIGSDITEEEIVKKLKDNGYMK